MSTISSILERDAIGLKRKHILALGLLAALSLSAYLIVGGRGFSLDDAWIHQAYARTLAARGQWGLAPGQPSAGATSVLWVLLLAPGAALGLAPFAWTWLLGWLALWALGVLAAAVVAALAPRQAAAAAWVGALLILEFHMVWAAASGMETALFAALCLAAMLASLRPRSLRQWFAVGALVGAAVLVRPDGLTLLGPLALAAWLDAHKDRAKHVAALLLGWLVLFAPYLLFNRVTSGQWWPNTFYAKQAEYAELLARPLLARLAEQWSQPLIGAGLLLLPGFVFALQAAWRRRELHTLAWAAWAFGFLAVFALRLPVIYQHGRYAMPVLPIYFAIASVGLLGWALPAREQTGSKSRPLFQQGSAFHRRVSFAWAASLGLTALAFYALGAQAHRRDVAFIDSQMVATAEWLAANTPVGATLAAHDIGALGYFAQRPLIDLAGLVSPEVIPFIRNEARIADYLYAEGAQYLVAFPDWYPQLSCQAELLFQAPEIEGAPGMAVYRWAQLSPSK